MMNSSPEESAFGPTLGFALAFGPSVFFALAFASTGLLRKSPILLSARAVLARVDLSLTPWLGGARPVSYTHLTLPTTPYV